MVRVPEGVSPLVSKNKLCQLRGFVSLCAVPAVVRSAKSSPNENLKQPSIDNASMRKSFEVQIVSSTYSDFFERLMFTRLAKERT